ncbi:phage capsid protein [Magnetovibrio sp. PR-2]|uniref:phage capsid protein n=1 Tax=Magnetovibrio sp. PR-2 TaxID=3120356 RepID=UPI002FCE160A
MSNTANVAFTQEWEASCQHELQQTESNLRSTVRNKRTKDSNIAHFPQLGAGTPTIGKARHSQLKPMNLEHTDKSITLTDIYATEWIDSVDTLKTNIDYQGEYTTSIVATLNRGLDSLTIDNGLANSTNEVSVSNTLNKAGIQALGKAMNQAKVPMSDRSLVIGAEGLDDILNDTTLTSRDFVEQSLLKTGKAENVLGFDIVYMEDETLLPEATTGRKVFAYWKNAVGLAMAQDLTIKVDRLPKEDMDQVMGKLSANAGLLIPGAVFWADIG